jgi:signal transduction histidine kinase
VATYSYSQIQTQCEHKENCWIQFQAPEDLIRAEINGSVFLSLSSPTSYHANEFFLLPLNTVNIQNIVIHGKDSNQDKRFVNELCLRIGNYEELRWRNSWQWFLRTGASLYSAYFLILISIFLGFSFWLRRSGIGFSLLIYSIVSTIYLFSFSEYPRSLIDPILASGGLHFPLRLLQDLCLIYVFYNFHQHSDPCGIIKKLSWVYAAVIGVFVLMFAIGIDDYKFYERIIIILAPLVAAPMAIGTWFAFKLKDPIERKILIPVSVLLFIFQLNDLLVFWKLIDSYFIVRLYIPFIVGMCLFLYFRRMHEKETALNVLSERQKILKEFLHDVKSPLAVLRVFFATRNENEKHTHVITSALDRIENMVLQIDRPYKDEFNDKFKVISVLEEVLNQKKLEYPDLQITCSFESDSYIFANKVKVQRIFSNLVNNTYEAYSANANKTIEVKAIFGADDIHIIFTDRAKGIPKKILDKLFKEEVTDKPTGSGIGLSSAYRYVKELGGQLNVISKENLGTTIEVILQTTTGDVVLSDIEDYSSEQVECPDIILIDDDRYIRLAWKLHAQNSGKTIKTYDSLETFFEEARKINKNTPIYLDINLNGKRSLDYLDQFNEIGFKNITLATGEDISLEQLPSIVRGVSGKLPPLQ